MHHFKVSPTNVSSPIQIIAALKEKLKKKGHYKKNLFLERENKFQDISTVGRRLGQKQKREKSKCRAIGLGRVTREQTDRRTDRQTGEQTARQGNRQTDRETDRQGNRQTDWGQTDAHSP